MKILISGYYGFDNAGDELILAAIVSETRSRFAGAEITVLSARPVETALNNGVKAANRWNFLCVIREIMRCDMLISGGGGLFQDRTGILSLYYYLFIIGAASLFRKKIFLWCVGTNQLASFNRRITGGVLNRADRITARDADTRDLFISWGCDAEKIHVTADPVLLGPARRSVLRQNNPVIGMIVRTSHRYSTPPDLMALLADSLSRQINATVMFIPFQQAHDLPWCKKILTLMQSPARLARWSTTDELIERIRKTDMVISQRLHGLILAALNDILMVGMSNDPKVERFVKEMGQKNIPGLSQEKFYTELSVIIDLWNWREDYRSNARTKLPLLQERARSTAGYL